MLLKAVSAVIAPAVIITLGPLGIESNTSIAETSKQLIEQYREIITQLIENQAALKE